MLEFHNRLFRALMLLELEGTAVSREYFKLIPTSHLILLKSNKILLLRRFNTGYEDGNYSVIAGHLDGNETFMQAMVREAREEAGLDLKPDMLEVVHVMHRKVPNGDERIDFFIRANKWTGEPTIMEPQKCDESRWFELNRLPHNVVTYVKLAIDRIGSGVLYSEHGW